MKRAILIMVILIAAMIQIMVIAKDKDEPGVILPKNAEGLVQYQETIEIPGATATTLFSRAKNYGAQTFKSAIHTLQNEDAAAGRLVYKGTFNVSDFLAVRPISFTMTIEVKEGKARIILVNFGQVCGKANEINYPIEKSLKSDGTARTGCGKLIENIDKEIKLIIEEFKKAMMKQEESW